MSRGPITSTPSVQGGAPCIRGTRMAVETVIELFDGGMSVDEISKDYGLSSWQVEAAIRYQLQHGGAA